MMSSTRASAPGVWMAGNSPDLRLSSCIPGIENDLRWRPTNGHSPSSNDPTVMKDDLPSSSSGFASKGMLDDESWYMAPENTLMDEMKELVGSQQQQQQQDNNSVSPAHFSTLDSSHLHGLFNRNNVSVSRSFSGLSSFLDTGMQFDGGLNNNNHRQGGGGGGNFLQQQLDNQSGAGLVSCSSGAGRILMPSLGPNVHSGNARGALLSNMSPRGTLQVDDGGGFNHHSTNLSNFLSSNGSFTTSVGGFSNHHHGLGAAGIGNGGFGDFQNNSLSRNLMAKDNNSLQLLNVERPPYLSKHLLSSSSPQKVVAPSTTTTTSTTPTPTPNPSSKPQTQTQQQKRGGTLRHAVSGGPISPSTVKSQSPRQVIDSVSNDSSVNMPDEDMHMSPNGKLDIPGPSSVSKEDIDGKLTQAHAHAHAHPAGSGSDDGAGDHNMMDAEPRLDREEGKDDDDVEESGDGSGLYETEDMGMEGHGQGTALSLPGEKGKGKKGLPAKNLMAERRRRKKLNDRLYMLRSVVPKITKMDRASILGDAIEYLKELLDRINDLHNELGSTTSVDRPPNQQNNNTNPALHAALPQPSASTVTTCRVKEELPSSIASPDSQQQQQAPQIPLRVDVNMQMGERRALNIHMFCSKRPGLLLSTMRALDGLGLEVQQAVVSCFNGFALDVFRAEQLQEGEIGSEEVRSVLLHAAGANLGTLE